MKNNGKVCDVRSLACKIKVLNGRVPGTWQWTIWKKSEVSEPELHWIYFAVLLLSINIQWLFYKI